MKKGQVTVYIIIGTVLLLVAAGFFVIRDIVVQEQITGVERIVEEVPSEFVLLRTFTEGCLEVVAQQGLIQLGQQGGHIKPSEWSGLRFNTIKHTDADGVLIPADDENGLQVPYWFYNSIPNDRNEIGFAINQPTIKDMETDLARFIEEEFLTCIDNYQSLSEQGFVVEDSEEPAAAAQIIPGAVRFSINYPIEAKKGSASVDLQHFFAQVPVDLLRLYNVADDITKEQQNHSFLEHHTLNIIEFSSGLSQDALPPMTDSSFELVNTHFWSSIQVQKQLRQILASNVALLRSRESRNSFEVSFSGDSAAIKNAVHENAIIPLQGDQGLDITFTYLPDWELFLVFNTESDTIQPQSASIFFDWFNFGMQRYKTVYDVSYPVLVQVFDPKAFGGKGYMFNFALENNVRNNAFPEVGKLPPIQSRYQENLLCNPNQRTSGLIRIVVRDAYSGSAIPNTAIHFTQGDTSCQIGLTDEDGVLATPLPVTIGGVLTASNFDFLGTSTFLDTELGVDQTVEMDMWKFKTINTTITKKKIFNCKILPVYDEDGLGQTAKNAGVPPIDPFLLALKLDKPVEGKTICFFKEGERTNVSLPLSPFDAQVSAVFDESISDDKLIAQFKVELSDRAFKSQWYFTPAEFSLDDAELGIFTLERQSANDAQHSAAILIDGSKQSGVRLVPGTYKVSAASFLTSGLLIPAEERCTRNPYGEKDECFDMEEIVMDEWPGGSVQNITITIDADSFYPAQQMYVPLLSFSLEDVDEKSRVLEDIGVIELVESASQEFKEELQPRYE